jgi:alanyl-tRNA synthetase
MEVCGGPHVQHTGDMGRFHIIKAETIGQGVQRIRADLFEVKNVPDNESVEE